MPDDKRDNDLGLVLLAWVAAFAVLVVLMWLVITLTRP
jgi:hypothetical protein